MSGEPCPCGADTGYEHCCGPVHRKGAGLGTTAEALMRARYSAYVRGDESFLAGSWHPDTKPHPIAPDPEIVWTGLEIVATDGGSGLDREGMVEFRAHYELDGRRHQLHERSRFVRLGGQWVYVDGNG
ncbi:MAG: YchJ family metal-binding protein [Actinomycetota bacterium]